MWNLNSPDLNAIGYYTWRVVERETDRHPHSTVAALKAVIVLLMPKMNRNHLIAVCGRFHTQIEAVIEANGCFRK